MVESPYLVLRGDGLTLMSSLLQRGVQVQFLTNTLYSTDAFYAVGALAGSLGDLQQANLQVWGYDGRPLAQDQRPPASTRWGVHAKRALFDDRTVVIGTYNIDPRSANLNSELIIICRDNPTLAQAHRVRVAVHQYLFAGLLALIVMFSVQAVGVLLVTALLIVPAAAARNLARSAGRMFWWALVISVSSAVVGLLVSAQDWASTATGATIVLVACGWFVLSMVAITLRDRADA